MDVAIITGEHSADRHMSEVVKLLKKKHSKISFWGTGGSLLESAGVPLIENIDNMSCMGFFDPIKKIIFFKKLERKIISKALMKKPKVAILVDFAGFNLNMAKKFKDIDVPVIYFITPKFWAWGKSRLKKIKKYVDIAATILPFEAELLNSYGVNAFYVGNPIFKQIPKAKLVEELSIGVIPGSRKGEIKHMLQTFIETAIIIKKKYNIKVYICKSKNLSEEHYKNIPKDFIIMPDAYSLMQKSKLLLVCSGTVSLEAALMHKPMVISYKTDYFSAKIFRLLSNTKYVGLPNIVLNYQLIPEILQEKATAQNLSNELEILIKNPNYQLEGLKKLEKILSKEKNYLENLTNIVKSFL